MNQASGISAAPANLNLVAAKTAVRFWKPCQIAGTGPDAPIRDAALAELAATPEFAPILRAFGGSESVALSGARN